MLGSHPVDGVDIEIAAGIRVRAQAVPGPGEPLLLVMGAAWSGLVWPDELLALLARRHRVIRYDHRGTGRASGEPPHDAAVLAADALAVLDAFDVPRAHVVALSTGGLPVQLLLLDHPDRIITAALLCAAPLPGAGGAIPPGPTPELRRLWAELDDPRDDDGELAWRVEHWRVLHGTGRPFDADRFRAMEQRVIAHTGHAEPAPMDLTAPQRGAELAAVTVPVLVIEGPEDPVHPPPTATLLADALGRARLVTITGLGHALAPAVLLPLAEAILAHTATAARS